MHLSSVLRRKIGFIKKYLRNPTMDCQSVFKSDKNKLTHSLPIEKRLYYEKKLKNVQPDTRAIWKVLNEILNRSKINSKRCSSLKAYVREITDPVEIAKVL